MCDSVAEFNYALNFGALSELQKFKYLLICEVEDKELIDDLHIEIENMASRLDSKTVINISKIDLISNLFKLFGLENESRYIIGVEHIDLDWKPCPLCQDYQNNGNILLGKFLYGIVTRDETNRFPAEQRVIISTICISRLI